MSTPDRLIRERRLAHGLTQSELALRAGTTQAAISRIERGQVSPTFATLNALLFALGEVPELSVRRLEGDFDRDHLRSLRALSPSERAERAIRWNRLAGQLPAAGRRARDERS